MDCQAKEQESSMQTDSVVVVYRACVDDCMDCQAKERESSMQTDSVVVVYRACVDDCVWTTRLKACREGGGVIPAGKEYW